MYTYSYIYINFMYVYIFMYINLFVYIYMCIYIHIHYIFSAGACTWRAAKHYRTMQHTAAPCNTLHQMSTSGTESSALQIVNSACCCASRARNIIPICTYT